MVLLDSSTDGQEWSAIWKQAFCCRSSPIHHHFVADIFMNRKYSWKIYKNICLSHIINIKKKNLRWRQGRYPLSYWQAPYIRESELSHLYGTFNSAHSRMGCLHRKRKSPPLEEEKRQNQKRPSGSRFFLSRIGKFEIFLERRWKMGKFCLTTLGTSRILSIIDWNSWIF